MAGKNEELDTGIDKRTERDNDQALEDFAEVDPGGEPGQPKNETTEEKGDRTGRQR